MKNEKSYLKKMKKKEDINFHSKFKLLTKNYIKL